MFGLRVLELFSLQHNPEVQLASAPMTYPAEDGQLTQQKMQAVMELKGCTWIQMEVR
jgi:hypothetical protein